MVERKGRIPSKILGIATLTVGLTGVGVGFWGIDHYEKQCDTMVKPYPSPSQITAAREQIDVIGRELTELIKSGGILRPSVIQKDNLIRAQEVLRKADQKAEIMKTPEFKEASGKTLIGIFSVLLGFFPVLIGLVGITNPKNRSASVAGTTVLAE